MLGGVRKASNGKCKDKCNSRSSPSGKDDSFHLGRRQQQILRFAKDDNFHLDTGFS
jgi:hypothetical protein